MPAFGNLIDLNP